MNEENEGYVRLTIDLSYYGENGEKDVLGFIESTAKFNLVLCNIAPKEHNRMMLSIVGKKKNILDFCNSFVDLAGDETSSLVIVDYNCEWIDNFSI